MTPVPVDQTGTMPNEWYFCLTHHAVETKDGCRVVERLGPYGTRKEAERALDTVTRRNVAWDNDPDWADDD
jgi:hypothetical protein